MCAAGAVQEEVERTRSGDWSGDHRCALLVQCRRRWTGRGQEIGAVIIDGGAKGAGLRAARQHMKRA